MRGAESERLSRQSARHVKGVAVDSGRARQIASEPADEVIGSLRRRATAATEES